VIDLTTLARRFVPERLKPPLRTVRRRVRTITASIVTPVRARAYALPNSMFLRILPTSLQRMWRLQPPEPGSRRVEIGSGGSPSPGYVHVDVDPDSAALDFLRSGHTLPFPDGWSDEVLSVHMIEHVPPPVLKATLREWLRVLRNGGTVRIHTPNGDVLGRALIDESGTSNRFWAIQSAIFGYGKAAEHATGPEQLTNSVDHCMLLTFPVLRSLLEETGFVQVEDVSGQDPCHHALEWAPYISGLCLEVQAVKEEMAQSSPGSLANPGLS
jgi:hypothetical protein